MTTKVLDVDGYTDVPDGKIAFIVTYLEMLRAPEKPIAAPRDDITLERWAAPDLDDYRALFRQVGEDWIWFGRLVYDDATLSNMLGEPTRENYLPLRNGKPIGTLELDFANPEEPEVAYFGLVPEAIGGGAGRWLMAQAVEMAWARPQTKRLWLHTCTGDSPQALKFYMSCGYRPYKRAVEIADDPRLLGLHDKERAPHIPVIG
ncbi:Acetyltransferase (GNAT) family protein [Labrenzia sp. THAF82]|uniref:GNAT family N-acetyltransferase n=1 Tax=Labrenzia sp. THAF82 TaxID=2587861 RepID=UPI0012697EFB|nr:GNAT family N-acetyltransferase [Labrenzia sp. THAF82]QFT30726.1 Acetyltransferase (GNAT) family protein [Labrenzia sp. THAF82]